MTAAELHEKIGESLERLSAFRKDKHAATLKREKAEHAERGFDLELRNAEDNLANLLTQFAVAMDGVDA